MDLAVVKELGNKTIYQAIPTHSTVPVPTVSATSATIGALYRTEDAQLTGQQQGPTGAAALIAGDVPSVETQVYLKDLTLEANAAASSLACGSILAGQTSETDEFGDVALWLGDGRFDKDHGWEVLKTLGFGNRLASVKMTPLALSPSSHLPLPIQLSAEKEATRLVDLLSQLSEPYAFSAENVVGSGLGALTVYILVGRLSGPTYSPGWAGLIGIGVGS